jgi:hypothetical protein
MGAITGLLAGFAFAESYSGRLLDSTCVDQNKSKNCDPTGTSTAFVIIADGKIMKLDDAGNAKAVTAMKNRSDRQKDPNTPGSSAVIAKVTGTPDGEVIRVDLIEIQ